MKRVIIPMIIATAIYANGTEANTTKTQMSPIVLKGVKAIKMLGGELKKNMKAKFKEDKSGLAAAKFCATQATEISAEVAKKFPKGVSVRRVATKYRNEANKPDNIDKKVLEEFQKELDNKTFVKKPKLVDANGTKRVYVPILVGKTCIKCHGQNINPKIASVIKEYYPNDKATGFKEGDLRGAMVAEIKEDSKK